jgi:predicted transposase YdaD
MFADGLFWHRLYAETARCLLQHPEVRHWQTVVLMPRAGLPLAPVSRALVEQQPELSGLIATMLWKRLPHLSLEEVMTIAGIQLAELCETRAYQDILAKGREEGLEQGLDKGGQREAALLVLKQLRRRFGSVSANDAATIGGLRTAALEDLAEALLAFGSSVDLEAWLVIRRGD